jgi:Mg2+ and Co2+ transporter CorA
LRSIEQNELAIVADIQNKAILVFTGATIVFLPLSFFTSYYGMNLQGIINTRMTEHDFWKVCGGTAFAIIILVVIGAFRHSLRKRYFKREKSHDLAV